MNEPRYRNQLLSALPADDAARLFPALEPIRLQPGDELETPGRPVDYVVFPESGIASVIAVNGAGRQVEAGPFGWDGMSGLAVVMQTDVPASRILVQVAGTGHRLPASRLVEVLDASPSARRLLLRYSYAFALQAAHTALAASIAFVEQRLARWLLMLDDRIDGDELKLTHDFMAFMLAVRRPGVTVALHILEGKGLIRSHRGRVIIRDRDGLIALCAGLYGVPEAHYRRLVLELDPEQPMPG